MSVFAQVWFWTLIAFFVGALLLWVLVARPAMQRAKEWERQAKTGTATQRRSSVDERDRDSGYAGAPPAPWRGEPDQGAPAERETPSGPTRWMERDSFAGMSTPAGAEIDERVEEGSAGRRYADQEYGVAEEYPLGEGRYPAGDQYAEQEYAEQRYAELEQAYDTERRYDIGVSEQPTRDEGVPGSMFEPTQSDLPSEPDQRSPLAAALEPDSGTSVADRLDGGYTGELQQLDEIDTEGQLVGREPETAEGAPVGALFEPTAPTAHTDSLFTEQAATAEPTDRAYAEQEDASTEFTEFQDEADTESASGPDIDAATGLPKRQRGASNRIRGGFEPPRPIQPSVRSVARRTPQTEAVASGSLFEPASAADYAGSPPPPARTPDSASASVPSGPFGPGSAMPLPGGGRPSPDFAVKASVTALRYCTEDSPQFPRMVAEVWFASVSDAERVGFRPLT